jgi:hypothetical protein
MSEESAALRHIFFAERETARVEGLSGVQPLRLRSVGIVGAGTMGAGIAASFLFAGLPVTLTDLKPEALTTARDRIDGFVARAPGAARAAALTIVDRWTRSKLLLERPVLARNSQFQPKTAFSRFRPVHSAGLEGQQRVDSGCSAAAASTAWFVCTLARDE